VRRLIIALALILISAAANERAGAEEAGNANRLLGEASPYLRQHAHNPVDWYPWGQAAFDKARRENKPILLSVGYSTCHWCHVMARESYENRAVARQLNRHFVAIKVDRERRPEVDETYMLATQLLTGKGGWPNTVFLTPDRKPFFAGSYYPQGEFKRILTRIADLWRDEQKQMRADADELAAAVAAAMIKRVTARRLTPQTVDQAGARVLKKLDTVNGGFSTAPKFPQAPLSMFLLRLAEKDGTAQALSAVTLTLDKMLDGAVYDHVGGGFHRYAVDARWRLPQFEKMLYTQAQLAQVLLRAYRLTGEPRYALAARRTLDYVLADLTDADGGFYAARDADSKRADGTTEEGAFYFWTGESLRDALGEADAATAERLFALGSLAPDGGKAVPRLSEPPDALAAALRISRAELIDEAARLERRMAEARSKRPPPDRDDKIVTEWNAMTIAALAEAAMVLGEARFRDAALRAGGFIWDRLYDGDRLERIHFEGRAGIPGTQADYAQTALASVALYDLTNDGRWIDRAERLADRMHDLFLDEQAGDYVMSEGEQIIGRAKKRSDSSTPSGNAVALDLYAKLSRRRPAPRFRLRAEALLAALSGAALETPSDSGYALLAGDMQLRGETGPRQFLGKGAVRATARMERSKGRLNIRLAVAPGWHVNAHEALDEGFTATQVTLEGLPNAVVVYPEALKRKLGFHGSELALYEGRVDLKVLLPADLPPSLRTTVKLQACSDELCLEPEAAELIVPVNADSQGQLPRPPAGRRKGDHRCEPSWPSPRAA